MLWAEPFAPLMTQATRTAAFLPPLDVTVSDSDIVLTMDVPGLEAEDLSVDLADGYLTIRGERKLPEGADASAKTHTERTFGRFERRIRVPDWVDPDRITANLNNGVLSLIIPKPEAMRPKTIAIETGTEQRQLETAAA